jgi:hypothetical protein
MFFRFDGRTLGIKAKKVNKKKGKRFERSNSRAFCFRLSDITMPHLSLSLIPATQNAGFRGFAARSGTAGSAPYLSLFFRI